MRSSPLRERRPLERRHERSVPGSCSASSARRRLAAAERALTPTLAVLDREVASAPRRGAPRRRRAARSSPARCSSSAAASSSMPLGGGSEETASTRVSRLPSERSAALRSRLARSAIWPRSALVTTSTSGISMIPDFRNCSTSPPPGCTTTATVSATSATSVSAWPDADRLDHDHVERRRQRLSPRCGSPTPARRAARRRRSSGCSTPRSAGSSSMRARSPSSEPPERRELGSTASTATVRSLRAARSAPAPRAASTCPRPVARSRRSRAPAPRRRGQRGRPRAAARRLLAVSRRGALEQVQRGRCRAQVACAQALA